MKSSNDEITFDLPIDVCGVSREVKGGHYSRTVGKLATPILCRLHGVDPKSMELSPLPLHDAACCLYRGHKIRVTMRVCKDGTLKLVRAE